MKARIISTGEEIELVDSIVHDENGNEYNLNDLFFFGAPIDWEQRRYEIAKGIISFNPFDQIVGGELTDKQYATCCIMIADALIEQLKGGEK